MKATRLTLSLIACLFAGLTSLQAEIVFLSDPASASASTSFAGDIPNWGPQRLYDAAPTTTDLETLYGVGTTQQYAGAGAGPHVVVYDYGSQVTFDAVAYSQRAGADPTLDKVQNIDVWVTDTDPGAASLTMPILSDPVGANTGGLLTADTTFRNYPLGTSLSGRWVVFRLNDAGGAVGNPGGSELHLTIDTAPADPNLTTSSSFAFQAEAGTPAVQQQIPISNTGASQTLNISGVTLSGTDQNLFSVISFPPSLAPSANGDIVIEFATPGTEGVFTANLEIASDDSVSATTIVALEATVTPDIPDDLIFLPDPASCTASSEFSATYALGNLYDADPTLSDLETLFAAGSANQWAGLGAGPHVVVCDFGAPVTFTGLAYSQRAGADPSLDKVQNIDVWVSNTDPGAASNALPILNNPVAGNTGQLLTTDTTFRNYDLGGPLTGRYVVLRFNDAGGLVGNPGGSELALTFIPPLKPQLVITHDSNTGELSISWASSAGELYNLRSETDPSNGDPIAWPIFSGNMDIVATPPMNTLSFTLPGDPVRFFVVESFPAPPPPPIFSDDFESVPNPDWTTGTNNGDSGNTVWERGAPGNFVSNGVPPVSGADGSTNCFGTNLSADYGPGTNIYLRSPAIDLSGQGFTQGSLTMWHYLDTDLGLGADAGSIRVLRASDFTPLGADIAVNLSDIPNNNTDWREFNAPLPGAAFGEEVVIEFQFTSDNADEFAGWYIDNVEVRAQ